MIMNYTHRTPSEINLFEAFKVGIQINSKNELAEVFKKISNNEYNIKTDNSSYYKYVGPQDLNSAKGLLIILIK